MIGANNVSLVFGERTLFKDVNIRFLPGNCYGLIGANGAGKSTFVKILSGEIEPTTGMIETGKGERIAVLSQDQYAFDDQTALNTVIMGHEEMYAIMIERDALYSKPDFNEEDGNRAAILEEKFAEMGGYDAESNAAQLLAGLGIETEHHDRLMVELEASQKVRILLAKALFGTPDILLLDEPTNQLDMKSIRWLEDFIGRFNNTVVVVSHDRHFLNNVCTHIADLDFGAMRLYTGNYDFWYRASQMMAQSRKDAKKRAEDRIAELKTFIQRFSANVAKAKQTTSRKKMIEKLSADDWPDTSRKFPYVDFKPDRPAGRVILRVENLTKSVDGELLIDNLSFELGNGDKMALVSHNDVINTTLMQLIAGELEPDAGEIHWGSTITQAYIPKENSMYFDTDLSITDWLRQYTTSDDETWVRGFLGRMLFSGEEALKSARVLSGGEKVRCMLSRAMLSGANTLILDEPTNHLDLEAIMALNDGLIRYPEVVVFASQDYEFVNTIANRVLEITPLGSLDRRMPFSEYIESEKIAALRDELYAGTKNYAF